MSTLYGIGELMIDFQPADGEMTFKGNAGGAPANVCVQAARLGQNGVYISRVAQDAFGDYLIGALRDCGVDVSHIVQTKAYETPFSFVTLDKDGERKFKFCRQNAADLHYPYESLFDIIPFDRGDVIDFGTVALTAQSSCDVHRQLLRWARDFGAIVAFDPNLRPELWSADYKLRQAILEFSSFADIIKVSKDEYDYYFSFHRNRNYIARPHPKVFGSGVQVLVVTDGAKGAKVYLRNGKVFECPGYKVQAVDTTGAGDAFFGAFLSGIMDANATESNLQDLPYQDILDFACKAGAYACTGYGAIPAMGTRDEILESIG